MDSLTYLVQSGTVFLIGLVPFLEIYVAIPAGLAMGLEVYSGHMVYTLFRTDG